MRPEDAQPNDQSLKKRSRPPVVRSTAPHGSSVHRQQQQQQRGTFAQAAARRGVPAQGGRGGGRGGAMPMAMMRGGPAAGLARGRGMAPAMAPARGRGRGRGRGGGPHFGPGHAASTAPAIAQAQRFGPPSSSTSIGHYNSNNEQYRQYGDASTSSSSSWSAAASTPATAPPFGASIDVRAPTPSHTRFDAHRTRQTSQQARGIKRERLSDEEVDELASSEGEKSDARRSATADSTSTSAAGERWQPPKKGHNSAAYESGQVNGKGKGVAIDAVAFSAPSAAASTTGSTPRPVSSKQHRQSRDNDWPQPISSTLNPTNGQNSVAIQIDDDESDDEDDGAESSSVPGAAHSGLNGQSSRRAPGLSSSSAQRGAQAIGRDEEQRASKRPRREDVDDQQIRRASHLPRGDSSSAARPPPTRSINSLPPPPTPRSDPPLPLPPSRSMSGNSRMDEPLPPTDRDRYRSHDPHCNDHGPSPQPRRRPPGPPLPPRGYDERPYDSREYRGPPPYGYDISRDYMPPPPVPVRRPPPQPQSFPPRRGMRPPPPIVHPSPPPPPSSSTRHTISPPRRTPSPPRSDRPSQSPAPRRPDQEPLFRPTSESPAPRRPASATPSASNQPTQGPSKEREARYAWPADCRDTGKGTGALLAARTSFMMKTLENVASDRTHAVTSSRMEQDALVLVLVPLAASAESPRRTVKQEQPDQDNEEEQVVIKREPIDSPPPRAQATDLAARAQPPPASTSTTQPIPSAATSQPPPTASTSTPAPTTREEPDFPVGVMGNSFDSDSTRIHAKEFIEHFFSRHDRDRQRLTAMYAPAAVFSLDVDDVVPERYYSAMQSRKRNSSAPSVGTRQPEPFPAALSELERLVSITPKPIVNSLVKLPPLRHETSRFVWDAHVVPGDKSMILLTVHGELRDFSNPNFASGDGYERGFDRTFVLVRRTRDMAEGPTTYVAQSDQLTWRHAVPGTRALLRVSKRDYRAAPAMPAAQSPAAPVQPPPFISPARYVPRGRGARELANRSASPSPARESVAPPPPEDDDAQAMARRRVREQTVLDSFVGGPAPASTSAATGSAQVDLHERVRAMERQLAELRASLPAPPEAASSSSSSKGKAVARRQDPDAAARRVQQANEASLRKKEERRLARQQQASTSSTLASTSSSALANKDTALVRRGASNSQPHGYSGSINKVRIMLPMTRYERDPVELDDAFIGVSSYGDVIRWTPSHRDLGVERLLLSEHEDERVDAATWCGYGTGTFIVGLQKSIERSGIRSQVALVRRTRGPRETWRRENLRDMPHGNGGVSALCLMPETPSSVRFVTAGGPARDRSVVLWALNKYDLDQGSGARVTHLERLSKIKHTAVINSIALFNNDRYLATGGDDKRVTVTDIRADGGDAPPIVDKKLADRVASVQPAHGLHPSILLARVVTADGPFRLIDCRQGRGDVSFSLPTGENNNKKHEYGSFLSPSTLGSSDAAPLFAYPHSDKVTIFDVKRQHSSSGRAKHAAQVLDGVGRSKIVQAFDAGPHGLGLLEQHNVTTLELSTPAL